MSGYCFVQNGAKKGAFYAMFKFEHLVVHMVTLKNIVIHIFTKINYNKLVSQLTT